MREAVDPEGSTLHEFCIRGLHCSDCATAVEAGLRGREGVTEAIVGLGSGRVCVTYDPVRIGPEDIEEAVRRMGYPVDDGRDARDADDETVLGSREALAAAVAGVLLTLGLVVELGLPTRTLFGTAGVEVAVHHLIFLGSMMAGGLYIVRRAVSSILTLSFTADALMVIAAIGATAIGEMAEGAAVLFLYSLAELLEDWSSERNRRSLRSLLELAPETVTVLRDGVRVEMDVEDVRPGDIALVRPGERLPVDGIVVEGATSINEATITGEAAPVLKEEGSQVFAGTMNLDGAIQVEVNQLAQDTTLARIISLVEEAEDRRAPVERFVDRFARWYTPSVLLGAVLVALLPPLVLGADQGTWFYRALMLLVIACPCALAISVPVAVVSAVSAAARRGILFKGGAYLELLSRIDVVALDKTGTLTTGHPRLIDVVPSGDRSRSEVLALAAGLEVGSEHHLARAVLEGARGSGVDPVDVEGFQASAGRGVEGQIDGSRVALGNPAWARDRGVALDEAAVTELAARGHTVVVLSKDQEAIGLLAFADTVRPQAREAVGALEGSRVLMLSGDSKASAKTVAEEVGIDEVFAPLLPEEKVHVVRLLRADGHTVAMVGDGVNDAPALAEADVGVAMGAVGSDVAMETADVVLMRDDIALVPSAVDLARRAMAVIRQNIFLAISIKVALVVLVTMGLATLWMAVAIGDMGASLVVILNALRLGASVGPRQDASSRQGPSIPATPERPTGA